MARSKNLSTIWAFGQTETQLESLRRFVGKKFQVENWPTGIVPSLTDYEKVQPCLAFFAPEAFKAMLKQPELEVRHLELLPKVMMLDEGYTQADLEFAIDSGMSEIIRPPYTRAAIQNKMNRALDIEAVHYDVLRMSKEIIVEREILERKNDILNFLVGFLTSSSITMTTEEIVEMVAEKLQVLFPVRSLQAAIWDCKDKSGATEIFISADDGQPAFDGWVNAVRDAVQNVRPNLSLKLKISTVELKGQEEKWKNALPSDGHVITLPISMDDRQFGVLLVLTDMVRSLSRDQAMALNSALRHLALTIKTAQNYKLMKQHAEFDSLTGLHNRRSFDQRIKSEVERAVRYGQPLSIIFADLDHFKDVNDSHGHNAGDAALKQLAGILRGARRSSDYVARYGGEEFVIILPHTDIKQAYVLAERLRREVAGHKFDTGAGKLRLTISQGIAELGSLERKNPQSLLCEADKALYLAKKSGRNRTISCDIDPAKVAV